MITPLQPREFFTGLWKGTGHFRLYSILRWFVPDQQVEYQGKTTWLSDSLWLASEAYQLSQAGATNRITYIRIVGPARLHMTCDDIPGGADILLHDRGFKCTPYLFRSPFAGRTITVKCIDEAILDQDGVLHDHIKMYYGGVHLASMNMSIHIDRGSSA
jgi:hypothetical protein